MDETHVVARGAHRVSRNDKRIGAAATAASPFTRAWKRFARDRVALVALAVTLFVLLFCLGAPFVSHFITHRGPADQVLLDRFTPPFSHDYILGADNLGRDELTRLAYGGRVSISVALLATLSALTLGASLGALAGYFGGWFDASVMRLTDVFLAIPVLVLLLFIASLRTFGPYSLALVIAGVSWMSLARLVRAEVLSLRRRDWVEAARVTGASDWRIVSRHLLPQTAPLIIVWAALTIPSFIIVEATLSFLGLGIQVPEPSWGNMLNDAQKYYAQSWTLAFIPGAAIYVTVLAINLLGQGLRDALDPRLGR
jgi:ABC-type dipeptide/oligopeptide/nickel transport system permease subunit